MTELDNGFELPNTCEICNESNTDTTYCCIKCGIAVCINCSDGIISDWEAVCKECGW